MHYTTIHTETAHGFDIVLSITDEIESPRDMFDDTEEAMAELCKAIDSGSLAWFTARVQAFKAGVLLASEYIGGCLYASPIDFLKDGYYADMVATVTKEANATIERLAQ